MELQPTAFGHVEVKTGVSLYYERHGSGPPLVLVAGTGCDHTFWRLQVPVYLEDHEVILLDTRGAGRSSVVTDVESYSPAVMADDVAGLLEALGIPAAHVAGHSLGSCIAQELVLRHPERVLSAQMHATWARADLWLNRAFIGTTRYPLALGDLQTTFKTVTMWMLSAEYLQTRLPERVAETVTKTLVKNPHLQPNEGMLGHLRADEVHDTADRLGQIRLPTLVTAGEADLLIPARYGKTVADAIPRARWHLFTGSRATHAYPWELEDSFNEVTRSFLREVS